MSPAHKPTFEEWLAVSELAFEWAESYDDKVSLQSWAEVGNTNIEKQDWARLRAILAPKLSIHYAKVNNAHYVDLLADDFITMMKDRLFLGDANIDSQHMLGLSKWEKVSDTEIVSYHQSRAAHMRWHDGRKEVAAKGHGHGLVTTFYKKIGDEWKWAGIETKVRWNEYEFEKVFIGTAGKFETE